MKSRELIGKTVNEGDVAEATIIDAKEEFFGDGFIILCLLKNRLEYVTYGGQCQAQTVRYRLLMATMHLR